MIGRSVAPQFLQKKEPVVPKPHCGQIDMAGRSAFTIVGMDGLGLPIRHTRTIPVSEPLRMPNTTAALNEAGPVSCGI